MLERDSGKAKVSAEVGIHEITIVDAVPIGGGYWLGPEVLWPGLHSHWGVLSNEHGERFLLTERPFERIDGYFGHLPSRLIEFYLTNSSAKHITVLDIGGGRDATAAREVAKQYPLAQVVNVDLVAISERVGNFSSRRGTLFNLGLPDATVDIAYSHQVLPYLNEDGGFMRHKAAIDELFRVLKPGGVAIIDLSNDLSNIGQMLGIMTNGLDVGVWLKPKSYDGGFLLMAKHPIEPVVIELGQAS